MTTLEQAKNNKIEQLKTAGYEFSEAGYQYMDKGVFPLSESGCNNILLKNCLPASAVDRYKFYTKENGSGISTRVDFEDEIVFSEFGQAVLTERDRIMRYDIGKSNEINLCETVEAVTAVVIDFSEAG